MENQNWINEFIKMLFPLVSSKLNIDGAYLLKNKYLPNSLYKYREFNENSIKNLEDDTIWLSSPQSFNDPYDSAFSTDYETLINKLQKVKFDELLGKMDFIKTLPEDVIIEAKKCDNPLEEIMNYMLDQEYNDENEKKNMKSILKDVMNKITEEVNDQFLNTIKNSFKLCSFSTNLESILLWSHYSKYHTGFCIEYDFSMYPPRDFRRRFLYPVIYRDDLFDVTEYVENAKNNELNILYLTQASLYKSIEWSYENEWRLIFSHGVIEEESTYYMGKPKAVYLGSKIGKNECEIITEILKRKGIPYYQMKISPEKFKIIPTTIT